jgi:hypothetical protein
MTQEEFSTTLRHLVTNGEIDPIRVDILDPDTRAEIVKHLIKVNSPILRRLVSGRPTYNELLKYYGYKYTYTAGTNSYYATEEQFRARNERRNLIEDIKAMRIEGTTHGINTIKSFAITNGLTIQVEGIHNERIILADQKGEQKALYTISNSVFKPLYRLEWSRFTSQPLSNTVAV